MDNNMFNTEARKEFLAFLPQLNAMIANAMYFKDIGAVKDSVIVSVNNEDSEDLISMYLQKVGIDFSVHHESESYDLFTGSTTFVLESYKSDGFTPTGKVFKQAYDQIVDFYRQILITFNNEAVDIMSLYDMFDLKLKETFTGNIYDLYEYHLDNLSSYDHLKNYQVISDKESFEIILDKVLQNTNEFELLELIKEEQSGLDSKEDKSDKKEETEEDLTLKESFNKMILDISAESYVGFMLAITLVSIAVLVVTNFPHLLDIN